MLHEANSSRGFVLFGLFISAILVAGGMFVAGLPVPERSVADKDPARTGHAREPGVAQPPGGRPPDPETVRNTLPPAVAPDPDRPLEVPPGVAGTDGSRLPASREIAEARVLLSLPLPPADAAEGRLVDAFPQDVIPPAPGATVLGSSIASSGNTLQAGLRAAGASGDVLLFYADHFTALEFQAGPRSTSAGTTTAVWSYGSSSITVSVGPAEPAAGPEYSVFAVLRAGI